MAGSILLLAAVFFSPQAAAQEPVIRTAADLTITDASTGQPITKRGITSLPGEALPAVGEEVFGTAFNLVVPPGNTSRNWIMFHCQVGWGQWQTLPARVNAIQVRSFGAVGHDHDGIPPQGSWSPTTGHTEPDLKFWTTYSAPLVSVNESFTVDYTFDAPGHPCDGARAFITWTLSTRTKGLIPLTATQYMLAEPVGHGHGQVLYGTPELDLRVRQMAYDYFLATRRKLRLHTASLPQGGLFDVNGDYQEPWRDHRSGTEIDVSGGQTPDVVAKLIRAGVAAGLRCHGKSTTLVHCQL